MFKMRMVRSSAADYLLKSNIYSFKCFKMWLYITSIVDTRDAVYSRLFPFSTRIQVW